MSATSPTKSTDRSDAAPTNNHSTTPPGDVFREAIESNSAICPRCFTRQRTLKLVAVPVKTAEVNGDQLGMAEATDAECGSEQVLYESWEATDTVELVYPPRVQNSTATQLDDVPASWKRACPEPTVYCTECGAIDDDGSRSTLSKDELTGYAKAVSRRLQEQDVEHDPALLVAVAKMLKSKPAVQAKDDLILKHATRAAVEKRRYGRSRQMRVDDDANEIAVTDATDVAWMTGH